MKLSFIPFHAGLSTFTKSLAGTVSQYISVKSASFMSRAMTFPPSAATRSTSTHTAGEGILTSSPVSCVILVV